MEQTPVDVSPVKPHLETGKSVESTDEPGTPETRNLSVADGSVDAPPGAEPFVPLHLPSGAHAEGTGPEVFWGGRRRASLVRRLERRSEQPPMTSSNSVEGAAQGWQKLREIFGQMSGVSESDSSDSDAEGKCKEKAVEPVNAEATIDPQPLPGGFMEATFAEVAEDSYSTGWQRLRRSVKDFACALGEGLTEARQLIDRDNTPQTAGPQVFWSGERRASLKKRLERREARRASDTTTLPDDEAASVTSGSSVLPQWLQGFADKLGGREARADTDVQQGDDQSLTAPVHGVKTTASETPWELAGMPRPTGRPRDSASLPRQSSGWRASSAVAAARSSPSGLMLHLRKIWRELGMPMEDEEGQMLVEILCETEGPWPTLPRRLPLSQVVGCAHALWEAENTPSAGQLG